MCVLLSISAFAQNAANVDQMMQGMAQMAACFQNIDQDKLAAVGQEAQTLEKELKQLCANGEREQAQDRAVSFALKVAESKDFQQLKQCGEMASQMMPQLPDYADYADPESEAYKNRHVCDEL